MFIKHWQICCKLENHKMYFLGITFEHMDIFDKYKPKGVSPNPECPMVIIWSKFWLIIQKLIKHKVLFFLPNVCY